MFVGFLEYCECYQPNLNCCPESPTFPPHVQLECRAWEKQDQSRVSLGLRLVLPPHVVQTQGPNRGFGTTRPAFRLLGGGLQKFGRGTSDGARMGWKGCRSLPGAGGAVGDAHPGRSEPHS